MIKTLIAILAKSYMPVIYIQKMSMGQKPISTLASKYLGFMDVHPTNYGIVGFKYQIPPSFIPDLFD